MEYGTNGKQQIPFISCKWKTDTENESLFSLVGKRKTVIQVRCFSKRALLRLIYSIYKKYVSVMFESLPRCLLVCLFVFVSFCFHFWFCQNSLRVFLSCTFYDKKKFFKRLKTEARSSNLILCFLLNFVYR